MQTYTHLAVGLVAGEIFFPGNYYHQGFVWAGSVLPDVASIVMYAIDKVKGRPPLLEQSKTFVVINGAFHSYFVWLFTLLYFPLFLGVYSHLWTCHISHRAKKYQETDPGTMWPLSIKLRGLFEYRDGSGKLFDRINVFTSILLLLFWFF